MHSIWTENFIVHTWDVDVNNRLTPAAVFNYCQEVAGNHATSLGVGKDALLRQNLAWILSRMTVLVYRRPGWGEQLTVRTWPRGVQKLFAIRDYDILDSFGETIVQGRSAWVLLDTTSRRPIRPQSLTDQLPLNENMPELQDGIPSLPAYEALPQTSSRQAAYSDIDYNGHVNNARYIQWIQDALPDPVSLTKASSFRLDINYLAEVTLGQGVTLYTSLLNSEPADKETTFVPGEIDSSWLIEGRIAASTEQGAQGSSISPNEQPAFRAKLLCGA
ncbi:MAG: acyl-ACP thioesterase domain-containing protein [Termitinemataceae bacterium]